MARVIDSLVASPSSCQCPIADTGHVGRREAGLDNFHLTSRSDQWSRGVSSGTAVGLTPLTAFGVFGHEDVVRPCELGAPATEGDLWRAGGWVGHALESQANALDHRRCVQRQRRQREVGHLDRARVRRILAGEVALRVRRNGPAAWQGQLDVAAVEDQDAVQVERLQSLTPAHGAVIVPPAPLRQPVSRWIRVVLVEDLWLRWPA
jgi:hypothetical protein